MSAFQSSHASSPDMVVSQMPHAIWRANQMASFQAAVTSSGFKRLDDELPNHGWPAAALIELLVQQHGSGEIGLLQPALAAIARQRRVALVQAPYMPHIAAWTSWDMPAERLLWVKPRRTADALWAAEQILRNGSCGALLFWQETIRPEAARRLHLAAQASETVFWMIRPLSAAQHSSPSPLRLSVSPARDGLWINVLKRRGPARGEAFHLRVNQMPASSALSIPTPLHHAPVDRRTPALTAARDFPAALV